MFLFCFKIISSNIVETIVVYHFLVKMQFRGLELYKKNGELFQGETYQVRS